jgi:hypothetical protein
VVNAMVGELCWKRAEMWRGLATHLPWADAQSGKLLCRILAEGWEARGPHSLTFETLLASMVREAELLNHKGLGRLLVEFAAPQQQPRAPRTNKRKAAKGGKRKSRN